MKLAIVCCWNGSQLAPQSKSSLVRITFLLGFCYTDPLIFLSLSALFHCPPKSVKTRLEDLEWQEQEQINPYLAFEPPPDIELAPTPAPAACALPLAPAPSSTPQPLRPQPSELGFVSASTLTRDAPSIAATHKSDADVEDSAPILIPPAFPSPKLASPPPAFGLIHSPPPHASSGSSASSPHVIGPLRRLPTTHTPSPVRPSATGLPYVPQRFITLSPLLTVNDNFWCRFTLQPMHCVCC